jgi:hypothetical protein
MSKKRHQIHYVVTVGHTHIDAKDRMLRAIRQVLNMVWPESLVRVRGGVWTSRAAIAPRPAQAFAKARQAKQVGPSRRELQNQVELLQQQAAAAKAAAAKAAATAASHQSATAVSSGYSTLAPSLWVASIDGYIKVRSGLDQG